MSQTATLPPVSTADTPAPVVNSFTITGVVWLPTNPPKPAPGLLTREEVALFLRLGKGAKRTIDHYVASGQLKAVQIGKALKFRLEDVQTFVKDKK